MTQSHFQNNFYSVQLYLTFFSLILLISVSIQILPTNLILNFISQKCQHQVALLLVEWEQMRVLERPLCNTFVENVTKSKKKDQRFSQLFYYLILLIFRIRWDAENVGTEFCTRKEPEDWLFLMDDNCPLDPSSVKNCPSWTDCLTWIQHCDCKLL